MAFMASRDKTMDNMPISFLKGKIKLDSTGKAVGIDFISSNKETNELVAKNTDIGDCNKLLTTHTYSD